MGNTRYFGTIDVPMVFYKPARFLIKNSPIGIGLSDTVCHAEPTTMTRYTIALVDDNDEFEPAMEGLIADMQEAGIDPLKVDFSFNGEKCGRYVVENGEVKKTCVRPDNANTDVQYEARIEFKGFSNVKPVVLGPFKSKAAAKKALIDIAKEVIGNSAVVENIVKSILQDKRVVFHVGIDREVHFVVRSLDGQKNFTDSQPEAADNQPNEPKKYEARLTFDSLDPDKTKEEIVVGRFDAENEAKERLVEFMKKADWSGYDLPNTQDIVADAIRLTGTGIVRSGDSVIRFDVRPVQDDPGKTDIDPSPETAFGHDNISENPALDSATSSPSAGDNTEDEAGMYKLEAYDKDGDVYAMILKSDRIDFLKRLGKNLWKRFGDGFRMMQYDTFVIFDDSTEKAKFVFNSYEQKWENA